MQQICHCHRETLKKDPTAQFWAPKLDPPPALERVKVILVGTRKAPNVGGSARALSAFECMDLVFVEPRLEVDCRACLSTSKGAQYLIRDSKTFPTLSAALKGCARSIAFTRWRPGVHAQYCLFARTLAAHRPACALTLSLKMNSQHPRLCARPIVVDCGHGAPALHGASCR